MNEPVYLGLSILALSKILMYKFWYDYVKPKYGEKTSLCLIDKLLFLVPLKPLKKMIFIKTLQKMLKQGLIFQIMN